MGERMGWPIASSCTPIAISKCIPRESRLRNRIPHRMFERLERNAGKLPRAVLRGRDGGNTILLPGGDGGNAVSLLDSGQRAGLYDTAFGVALLVVANGIIFATLVWWTAGVLSRLDADRRQTEETLAERARLVALG